MTTLRAKPATVRPTLPGELVGINDLHHVHYREVAVRRRGGPGECDWWDSLMPGDDYDALRIGEQLGGIITTQIRVGEETRLVAKLRRVGA